MDETDEIAAFYAARLDEDEAVALRAARKRRPPWRLEGVPGIHPGRVSNAPEGATPSALDGSVVADVISGIVGAHVARHDPGRALREVEAGRAEIARWRHLAAEYERTRHGADMMRRDELATVLRHRAAVWDDHAEYKPVWKP
jgi:hypothetical protein